MRRRKLFTLIPALSAGLALRSHSKPMAPSALSAAGFAISVQCWSFRKFTLFEAIEKSAAAGASAVEIYPGQKIGGTIGDVKVDPSMPDDQVAAILDHCAEHHITPANYGVTDVPKDEAKARGLFEFAKKLGLYGITTESLESLDTLEKLAKEFDIKVCFHNHPKPTKLWNPDKIWKAIEGRDERIGFCADIGHWATSGLVPLEVIRNIAPRVHAFHMKDRAEVGKWTHDRPFGTGIIDNIAILDEVRKHGFAGNVSIEYEHNWDVSQPEIAQCVGYLRAYGKMRA
ncbi:sugar phosphate isomerase/epimerase family protein [Haloferula sp.]|uniref:sugar phosphate isomerase/epimerase family protein n=1 Tax=Haloferula sp. TaxID=2497595 RepID=UPI0032A072AB